MSARPTYQELAQIVADLEKRLALTQFDHLQEQLKKSRHRFQEIMNRAPAVIYVKDTKGKYTFVNRHFEDLSGYRKKQILGKTDSDLFPPEVVEKSTANDKQVLETGKPMEIEERGPVDGEMHTFISLKFPIFDDTGGVSELCGLSTDITDRIRAEAERKRLEEQLRQSRKMEAIGTLAGGIAHDFNNILGIILGNTELAVEDVPDWNPARRNLGEVIKACFRARDMVRQLLNFSRKNDLEKKPIKIPSLIEESLKLLRSSLPTSIEIRQNLPKNCPAIHADPTQIHQLLINLCTNAAHAMEKKGGVLEIAVSEIFLDKEAAARYYKMGEGHYVRLSVSDTGEGIDPLILDRIFDPYFTTKGVGKGTGMGLAVVHGIVESHKGGITVYSEPGRGTRFHILFPAIEADVPPDEVQISTEIAGGSERILFVDDEEAVVLVARQMLERIGYDFVGFTAPDEALQRFRNDPLAFDLLITDMTMPKMSGDLLAKEILSLRPEMPIIICTGFSEKITRETAMNIGIRDYLEKPLNRQELSAKVREAIEAAKGA